VDFLLVPLLELKDKRTGKQGLNCFKNKLGKSSAWTTLSQEWFPYARLLRQEIATIFKNKRKENNMVSNNKSPRYGKKVAKGSSK